MARERYRGYEEGRAEGYTVLEAFVIAALARGTGVEAGTYSAVACKPGRHFHGLRSLAVTTLASLGLSWQVISMLTGHKNPEMIDHYNRPGKDQFAEGMRKYDNHLRLVS